MILSRKSVDYLLRVGNESVAQVKEFKYLGVLFVGEGTIECEISQRIRAAGAVLRSLYHTVVTKRELSRKAKLSIYRSIFVPTLTYGHEGLVMTEMMRLGVQAAKMGFLRRVDNISLRDRLKRSTICEELGLKPLLLCF